MGRWCASDALKNKNETIKERRYFCVRALPLFISLLFSLRALGDTLRHILWLNPCLLSILAPIFLSLLRFPQTFSCRALLFVLIEYFSISPSYSPYLTIHHFHHHSLSQPPFTHFITFTPYSFYFYLKQIQVQYNTTHKKRREGKRKEKKKIS